MTYVKTTLALAAAIGAFASISASAMGSQFIAKKGSTSTGEFQIRGAAGSADAQEFEIGGIHVTCAVARAQGTVTVPETLTSSVTFKQCSTEVIVGERDLPVKTVVKGTLELEYEPLGGINTLSPLVIESKALHCTIELLAGAGGVTYANEADSTTRLGEFPSGVQQKLETEYEAFMPTRRVGACEALAEGEGSLGTYRGRLPYETIGGDLGFSKFNGELPGGWSKVHNEAPGGGI